MKIFIDSEYKCHIENDGTMREFEVPAFFGKCEEYIEGFRYIPEGESLVIGGREFMGEMLAPFVRFSELDMAQYRYEREKLDEVTRENDELVAALAEMVETVYESDLERYDNV